MLTIRQLTLSRGHKILLKNANVSLFEHQKIGLVGHNGCGKSSLFSLFRGQLMPDVGECQINSQLRISHLSQQLPQSDARAQDFVLQGDEQYSELMRRLSIAEKSGDDADVIACHELLNQTAGYGKPAKAASILAGLGFTKEEQLAPVDGFSGGWRMRLSLARCLMKPADLLLLDEPTNHLDLEATFWLERFLKQVPSAVILISHDRDFLDSFVTHILHIEHKNLVLYSGNYSRFELARAQKMALQNTLHEKQQQKINHMMAFVQRFSAKASKAKQAQSRLKAVAQMDVVLKAQMDSPFSFDFYPCPRAGKILIQCSKVVAGYERSSPILKNINLSINPGERLALMGANGQGKSTLIKTLTGDLLPLSGEISRSANLKIGYYAQHQLEQLDNSISPLETILRLSPNETEQTIRDFLGGFAFVGDVALHSICHFSGGEKARLALAKLVWQKPNLLLLDEPTNHLDLGMRAAIEIALQSYEGALVLISHDRHFLRTTVDDFYRVFDKKVELFPGNLNDYYELLQNREKNDQTNNETTSTQDLYRIKRTLQNRLKKLEQLTQLKQQTINELEIALAQPSLYLEGNEQKLQEILQRRDELQKTLETVENDWMQVMNELDAL